MEEEISTQLSLIASRDEVDNVRTFIFETGNLEWVAGQFQAYRLPQVGGTDEENERWFTISSAPVEGTINISTRISASPFEKALNSLKPGDEITTHGLGGKFVWEEDDENPVVLVAAGIGITPFRSILLQRSAVEKPLNATLLYFNRTSGIPFQKELEDLARRHPEFDMKLLVGEPVTVEKMFQLSPKAKEQLVFTSLAPNPW